ncbi:MAG: TauD/TfdA family dioxygenase [Beijerinckiaceae bacterium]|nr:TauD/TfdA family dioxygenase [Beijerinckiaceae bacterium]
MLTEQIEVQPLSPVLGARITGIDLARETPESLKQELRDAFNKYGVLCVSNQKIEPEDQIRFAAIFGRADASKMGRPVRNEGKERERGIMLITNIRENGQPIGALPDGEMHFHSDGSHRDVPYRATTLYAVQIPSRGGETKFANLYEAYDTLPEVTKKRIAGLKAGYIYDVYATLRDQVKEDADNLSNAVHPLVKTHPATGRKSLYLSRLMTRNIVGMDRAESDALLEELFEHAERPEFVYAHEWAVGDLLIWDNRCLNHARNDFPAEEIRLMRRVTVSEPE